MGAGYDAISSKRRKTTDPSGGDKSNEDGSMPSSNILCSGGALLGQGEEIPMFINNIVYCRDPKIMEEKCLLLRNLMQHENFLDIK
jgi:hypothetical protein